MASPSAADRIAAILGDGIDYAIPDHSFSPCYSDIGLKFAGKSGIGALWFHYNRGTTMFGAPFVAFDADGTPAESRTAFAVRQEFPGGATAEIAFYDRNAFVIETRGVREVRIPFAPESPRPIAEHEEKQAELKDARPWLVEPRATARDGCLLLAGYLPARDRREPDSYFPIRIGMRVIAGSLSGDGIGGPVRIAPGADGRILVALTADALDVDERAAVAILGGAPDSIDDARERTREWLDRCLGALDVAADDPAEERILARAAFSLAMNLCAAPGILRDKIALFPARGSYAIVAPWDSCFQNLALEHMEPRLAEDSLRILLADGIRADGKIACFIASTWVRPELAQPALFGWAAERLYDARGDVAFVREILPGMWRNCRWWLTQRMTRYGVISCPHGIESGWDNSPRWDRGPILAVDMNTWLLMQLRTVGRFARLLGDDALAADAREDGDALAARMMDVLYDPAKNRFRDVVVATGEPVDLLTPAAVLPLRADIGLPESDARRMIETYLLDPARLFGPIPFPSVAYDEPVYESWHYWRGPTWMPVGWMMLEILDKYGYAAERRDAAERLYRMAVRDGDLREWFDSTTGAGLGAHDQGWTAAIFLRLRAEIGR